MSGVSIKFRPVVDDWQYVNDDSALYKALNNLFCVPCRLDESMLPQIRAIDACGVKGEKDLIKAIIDFGCIEIKAEH